MKNLILSLILGSSMPVFGQDLDAILAKKQAELGAKNPPATPATSPSAPTGGGEREERAASRPAPAPQKAAQKTQKTQNYPNAKHWRTRGLQPGEIIFGEFVFDQQIGGAAYFRSSDQSGFFRTSFMVPNSKDFRPFKFAEIIRYAPPAGVFIKPLR